MTVVGHRGQRQLLVARHPDLAHHQHVERRPERRGHLGGHGDAAPGQPEDDDVTAREVGQPGRELAAGVAAVGERGTHVRQSYPAPARMCPERESNPHAR